MGERHGWLFESAFNRSIKLRQADPRITSDAGALLLREVDHRLGLTADLAAGLYDPRCPRRRRYEQVELLRQHLYGLALGYAHQDDADSLAHDVALKLAVWDRPGKQVLRERLASQPSDWRLVNRLSSPAPRRAINEALGVWVGRHQQAAGGGRKVLSGTLDIDPFPIEVHGNQQGGAYHGHYRKTMYYPIVAGFCAEGSYESRRLGEGFVHAILRKGNASGAEGARRFVKEAIRKARPLAAHLDVRIDAGLVEGPVLDAIDDEGVSFVGRIKNNARLDKLAEPHLGRDPGRPTKDGDEWAIELGPYRAASWTRPYRLVLVVIDLPDAKTGRRELFPRYFFLVTNWSAERRSAWDLLEHYRKRGTFEDRLGEFNAVIGPGLPAESFVANEASLLLKLLAFNLAGMIRGELEDSSGNGWDLRRVQQTVLKAGARVVEHAQRLIVDVAAAAGVLWARVLDRVGRWWRDEAWGRDAAGRRAGPRPRPWVAPPAHAHLCLVLRE
ncbi:MAG TPA: IS1380 family transposase [Phycisphaerae bacterium]|nr:IS1380 family transposase [Phycisphaerae bacterium]